MDSRQWCLFYATISRFHFGISLQNSQYPTSYITLDQSNQYDMDEIAADVRGSIISEEKIVGLGKSANDLNPEIQEKKQKSVIPGY